MKPSGKDWLLWLLALTMSLVLLVVTRSSRAQSLELRHGDAIWKRTVPVKTVFVDVRQRQHPLSCDISAVGHQREIGSVGFTARQRAAWLNPRMYERAQYELPTINLQIALLSCTASVFPSDSMPPGKDWWVQTSLLCSSNEKGFAQESRKSIDEWRGRLDIEAREILKSFYKSHNVLLSKEGLANSEDKFYINYDAVIRRATPLLADCAHALYGTGGDVLDANIFASFLQQLAYVKLVSPKGEYHVHDFLVPTQVLVEKRGDCDSKAAAFCALWRNYSRDVILLLSEKHALVGYKAPPNTPLRTFPVKGIQYIPCDVSGINNFPCGTVPPGNYRPILLNR